MLGGGISAVAPTTKPQQQQSSSCSLMRCTCPSLVRHTKSAISQSKTESDSKMACMIMKQFLHQVCIQSDTDQSSACEAFFTWSLSPAFLLLVVPSPVSSCPFSLGPIDLIATFLSSHSVRHRPIRHAHRQDHQHHPIIIIMVVGGGVGKSSYSSAIISPHWS